MLLLKYTELQATSVATTELTDQVFMNVDD